MKAIAYLCSYKQNDSDSSSDLIEQRAGVEEFCEKEGITIQEYFIEQNSSREDYKPVLLNIINSYSQKTDKLIMYSPEVISKDEAFRDWLQEELLRIGIDIISVKENEKLHESENTESAKVLSISDRVKNIPSLPEVVTKVIQLVQDEKSSSSLLAKVISQDAGLTTRVLRLVNSSYYGFSRQIGTIQEAITILGITTIRGLVLSSSIFKMFSPKASEKTVFDYSKFWKHNLLTAIGAKFLSELLFYQGKDDVFSAAILHDLGKVILAQYEPKNYAQAYALTYGSFDSKKNLKLEEEFCETNHCKIAHTVACAWNLPEVISDVILYHHSPNESEKFKLPCIIVYVADILSNLVLEDRKLDFNLFDIDLLAEFSISQDDIQYVYDKLVSETHAVNDIERFFK